MSNYINSVQSSHSNLLQQKPTAQATVVIYPSDGEKNNVTSLSEEQIQQQRILAQKCLADGFVHGRQKRGDDDLYYGVPAGRDPNSPPCLIRWIQDANGVWIAVAADDRRHSV